MRKLVKKLALVLALVLAIGCVAPAGAQAAVKAERWTWNFDAEGIKKPTKDMYVGDTYEFLLLDKGVAVDTEKYSVKYYSRNEAGKDHDALLVNKSSGVAAAVAAAQDVKLAAVVKNKTTGNMVKVWAFVDIHTTESLEFKAVPSVSFDEALTVGTSFTVDAYVGVIGGNRVDAEIGFAISNESVITSADGVNFSVVGEGETQIVFAAEGFADIVYTVTVGTPAPTPTPVPSTLEVVSVKQLTKTSFEVTFNKEIGKGDVKAKTAAKLAQKNSTLKFTTPIKSATAEGNVLTVVLYNTPANEQTVYVTYDGVEAPGYKVNIGDVAEITINTALVEYQTFADINVTAKDANGTLLYSGKLSANTLNLTAETTGDNAYDAFISTTNQIYFMEEGKSVDVIVKSADGKASAGATISSVESVVTEGAYDSFAIDAAGKTKEADLKKLTYKSTGTIAVGESKQLYAKRTITTVTLETETKVEYTPGKGYTYTTTDSSVLLVNATSGLLIPISEGLAEILIWDGETVIAVCPITVTSAKKATAVTWKLSKNNGSNYANAADTIKATVTVTDQYGKSMTAKNSEITIKDKNGTVVAFDISSVNSKGEMTIQLKNQPKGTYTATLKSNGLTASNALTFVVNEPDLTKDKTYKLQTDKSRTVWDSNPAEKNTLGVTLYEYDINGVAMGTGKIAGHVDDANPVAGNIYYDVIKVAGKDINPYTTVDSKGILRVTPYIEGSDGTVTVVEGTCNFVAYVYREFENGTVTQFVPVASAALTINSSQGDLIVKVDDKKFASAEADNYYNDILAGVTVKNGSFSVTSAVSGSSLDNELAQAIFDSLKIYVGKEESKSQVKIAAASNSVQNLDSIVIEGYADGTSTVVISNITVTATLKKPVAYEYSFESSPLVFTFKQGAAPTPIATPTPEATPVPTAAPVLTVKKGETSKKSLDATVTSGKYTVEYVMYNNAVKSDSASAFVLVDSQGRALVNVGTAKSANVNMMPGKSTSGTVFQWVEEIAEKYVKVTVTVDLDASNSKKVLDFTVDFATADSYVGESTVWTALGKTIDETSALDAPGNSSGGNNATATTNGAAEDGFTTFDIAGYEVIVGDGADKVFYSIVTK